jgi:hypothetical protein
MPKTYEPIATTTLTTDQSEVEFTNISQNYTDLIIVKTGAQNSSSNMGLRVGNGTVDTASNYSGTQMYGNGTSALSDRYSNDTQFVINFANSSADNIVSIIQIMNYSNTTTNKTILVRNNNAANYVSAYVHLWRSTAAINRLLFRNFTNGLKSGSTFTLYGIKAA